MLFHSTASRILPFGFLLLQFADLCTAAATSSVTSTLPKPTVTAAFGKIIGQQAPLQPTVNEFLGISYAYPPTGSRRFAPPVRIANRAAGSAPLVATKLGFSCPSVALDFGPTAPINLSGNALDEDCLNLNVWTKPGRSGAPVMVWIVGGGFHFGAVDTPLFDGAQFTADNEVVMVTISYRSGVLGFPNSPVVERENLGILDQRMAMEWIRENIQAFGGDPTKITLFGQSAGATSIDIHAYAWPKDPIAHGLILGSGTLGFIPLLDGNGEKYAAWNNLTKEVGCDVESKKQVLKCMQAVPWQKLLDGVKALETCDVGFWVGFSATPDGKVVFTPEEYKQKGKLGQFAKVPLFIGHTDKEFQPGSNLAPPPEGCPPKVPKGKLGPDVIAELSTAGTFGCTVKETAGFRLLHQVPVWRYRYFDSFNSGLNAGHGSDLPVVFGAALLTRELSPRQVSFIKYYQSVWSAFAKSPSTGLSDAPINLPRYDPTKQTLIRLDYEEELKASTTYPEEYDYLCEAMAPKVLS